LRLRVLLSSLFIILILNACKPGADLTPTAPFVVEKTPTQPSSEATFTPLPTSTPHSSPTPTMLPCRQEGGVIVEGQIESKLVHNPFEFLIYLPPCYQQEPERYYPVLYLIHGQSFKQDQWERLGADEIADRLIAEGEISPFIVVMPRVIEVIIDEQPPDAKFGQAMVDEMIPYIDETYRTIPDREFRAVGGLSRGAAWALHLSLSRWDLFGIFGAHSLPIFLTDSPQVRSWLDAIPKDSYPRVYIDVADQDLKTVRKSTEWFRKILMEKDIPFEFHEYPGIHNEEYWSAHLEEYIRFYSQEW